MEENTELVSTDDGQVNPVPAIVAAIVKAEADEVADKKPTEAPVEDGNKKQTAAFIKMRQELRELKRKMAGASQDVKPAPVVTEPVIEQVQPKVEVQTTAPATDKAAKDIEEESAKAIAELGNDKELATIPGGVIDLIELVDSDPRLSRLHSIDPVLAFRERKAILMGKYGISAPPPMPKSNTPSGGMANSHKSLEALIEESSKYKPGSREYTRVANEITAEMRRQGLT